MDSCGSSILNRLCERVGGITSLSGSNDGLEAAAAEQLVSGSCSQSGAGLVQGSCPSWHTPPCNGWCGEWLVRDAACDPGAQPDANLGLISTALELTTSQQVFVLPDISCRWLPLPSHLIHTAEKG